MTTETATIANSGSDALTAGEMAYFSSRGSDTAALERELGNVANDTQAPTAPNPVQAAAKAAGGADGADEAAADAVTDPDDIVIGEDGKARNKTGQFVKHVPLAALHKEREKRRAVDSELMTQREKVARADERLAILNEMFGANGKTAPNAQAARPEADEIIDPEKDIFGAFKQAMKKIETLNQKLDETRSTTQAKEAQRTVAEVYKSDVSRFAQETPDFTDAYQSLVAGRHRELEAMGVSDKLAREAVIAKEAAGIVNQAVAARQSPAQLLYNLAIARGYAKPAAAPAGATPPNAAAQAPADKIDQIARGQRVAGASLSGAGGTSGEGLTVAALADMNEAEFSAWKSKAGKEAYRRLMGG